MATKSKQIEADEQTSSQTWRKPLQVPPRANSMRSFYRGAEEAQSDTTEEVNQAAENEKKAPTRAKEGREEKKTIAKTPEKSSPKIEGREAVTLQQGNEFATGKQKNENNTDSSVTAVAAISGFADKLTKEDLSEHLGLEIEDLFDVHELLRGKSFDIYRQLRQSADANGRSKITQPELMKRTSIKNRRTFYKHEEWLIKLKLLEKRHLPGDHKGVVYRVLQLSDVLPFSPEMLEKFKRGLEDVE